MKKLFVVIWVLIAAILLASCSPAAIQGVKTPTAQSVESVPTAAQPKPTQATEQESPLPPPEGGAAALAHFMPGETFLLSSVAMQDPANGWAIGGREGLGDHVFTTADGGVSWRDVTPPETAELSDKRVKVAAGSFLDLQHAWVTYFYVPTADGGVLVPAAPVVWRTQDGGATWQASPALPMGSGEPPDYRVARMQFVDAEHGWLLVHVGGMSTMGILLFQSQDGGATWERLLDPSSLYLKDGNIDIYFQDASNGWATGSWELKTGPFLMRTQDAGRTWQPVELPEPADLPGVLQTSFCMTQSLQFVTPQDGFVAAGCASNGGAGFQALLWSTHDGGESWQASLLPGGGALGFATPQKGWLLAQPASGPESTLYATQDGGKTWVPLTTLSFNTATPLEPINFVDESNGFLVTVGVENGSLAYTHDGGVSWKVVPSPQIIP